MTPLCRGRVLLLSTFGFFSPTWSENQGCCQANRRLYAERPRVIVEPLLKAPPPAALESFPSNSTRPLGDIDDLIHELWRPMLHDIKARNFTGPAGKTHSVPDGDLPWTEKLGKKVLILDVDSRHDDMKGGLMHQGPRKRKGLGRRSAGRLTHIMYAMVHGYDYRFVRAPNYPDRHGTWVKVPVLREALNTHDVVVFMDDDVSFVHLNLPLEWLLNYWGVQRNTSLTMARDADSPVNHDSKGLVLLNTGFIIATKGERTQEMLSALESCPDERRYPGCGRWAKEWAHEQRAFGEYVRYEFNKTTDFLPLKFHEANTPQGWFVRHDWFKKRDPLEDLDRSIMDFFIGRLHRHFHEERRRYFRDFSRLEQPLEFIDI